MQKKMDGMKPRQWNSLFKVAVLLVVLVMQSGIRSAGASDTIYIRSDGSVNPSSAPIHALDNITYEFDGDVNGEIVVQRSNIMIDGRNHTVRGTGGGYGLNLNSVNGVVITNTNVRGFGDGFWLSNSFNISIVGNRITESTYNGISLYSSSNNNIDENDIAGGRCGIYLSSSSENNIWRNNLTCTEVSGLQFEAYSNNNTLTLNMFVGSGVLVSYSFGNVLEGNTVNSKPLVFLEDVSDCAITDAGQVVLVNCANVQIENIHIDDTAAGLELWNTSNARILSNKIENSYFGIRLSISTNVSVVGNTITGNNYGVELWRSSQTILIHNNFVDNVHQVHDDAWDDPELTPSAVVLDSGYASGGNFWSGYTGVDLHDGVGQNEDGSDAIGDTAYVLHEGAQDNYPLMGTFFDFIVSSENHVQIISNLSVSEFQFNGSAIFFNLTLESEGVGFCRINIPLTTLDKPHGIFLNGTMLNARELPSSDSKQNCLYFTYNGSTDKIIILPEFTTSILFAIFMTVMAISLATRAKARLHTTHPCNRNRID